MTHLIKFLPVSLLQYLCDKNRSQKQQLPEMQQMRTVVLVCEIKQFYNNINSSINGQMTAEAAAAFAKRSEHITNENLAQDANQFLELTSKIIHKYGGDILQFLGNSLIALWNQPGETDLIITRRAVQCAIEIRNERMKCKSQPIIQMGLGFGEVGILHVGGVFKRVEFFVAGDSLAQALRSLELSNKQQHIVISSQLHEIIHENFETEAIKLQYSGLNLDPDEFEAAMDQEVQGEKSVIQLKGSGIGSKVNTLNVRSKLDGDVLKELLLDLKAYIPAAFRPYLKLKRDTAGNEHRRLSIMAINIEIAYDLANKLSLVVIQKLITIIQQQIYRMEGSLNKIIAYNEGFTVVACWGVSPYSHDDDAARAVIAGQNIKKKIERLAKALGDGQTQIPLHIGISTGSVYMGIIGNDGGRKEVIILGQAIERAFLFMQASSKVYGKIFVDYETRQEAQPFIDFQYKEHYEFANKLINLAVFEPIEVLGPLKPAKKQTDIIKQLRLHQNPFIPDYDLSYQQSYCKPYGLHQESSNVINQIVKDIGDYITQPDSSTWILAVKGDPGSGKTLFARALLSEVLKKQTQVLRQRNFIQKGQAQDRFPQELSLNYIVTSCNAEVAKHFLGVWIPVIREIMSILSAQKSTKVDSMLNSFIQGNHLVENKVAIIEDLFGIKGLKKNEFDQIMIMEDPMSFVNIQSYPKEVEEDIIEFIHQFIREAVFQLKNDVLFFLILDNASLMDRASWNLLYLISLDCEQFIIVLCLQALGNTNKIQQSSNNASQNFKIAPNSYEFYKANIGPVEQDLFNIFEVDPLSAQDLRQLLIDLAKESQKQLLQEISLATQIIDGKNQIKTYQTQTEVRKELMNYHQINDTFVEIEKDLVYAIIDKCGGNPQICVSLMHQLLLNGQVEIRERIILCSINFRHSIKTKCWNDIQVPPLSFKSNCQLIESLNTQNSITKKFNQDKFVNAFEILKVASVIGEIFTQKQILKVSESLTDPQKHKTDTIEILSQLEQRALIEVVFEDQKTEDKFYRFDYPFLRETLFKLQLYSTQRQVTHGRMITYLQQNLLYNWQTDWNYEKEVLIFLQHLLLHQGCLKERDLPLNSRKQLVIKKVNCALAQKSVQILKVGDNLEQIKFTPKRKIKSRVVVLTRMQILIYKNKEQMDAKQQKNAIDFDQITKVNEFKEIQNPKISAKEAQAAQIGFMIEIQCNEYYKKLKPKDRDAKIFILQLQSQREGEEWISYIEYLRTIASLKKFQNSYGVSTLPSNNRQKEKVAKPALAPNEKFALMVQRQIQSSKGPDMPLLSSLTQGQQTLDKQKPRNQILLQMVGDNYPTTPDSVGFLKNTIESLYSVLIMKTMHHLSQNANKAGTVHQLVELQEDKDQEQTGSFAGKNEQESIDEKAESKITRIAQIAQLRRNHGQPTGIESSDSEEIDDSYPSDEENEDPVDINMGGQVMRKSVSSLTKMRKNSGKTIDIVQFDLRRDSFFNGIVDTHHNAQLHGDRTANLIEHQSNSLLPNSRTSIRVEAISTLSHLKGDELSKIDEYENQKVANDYTDESLFSYVDMKPQLTLSYEENFQISIKDSAKESFKEGAHLGIAKSSKNSVVNNLHVTTGLKRRKLPVSILQNTQEHHSIGKRQLQNNNFKQRQSQNLALSRVLDKARVVGQSSQTWLRSLIMHSVNSSSQKWIPNISSIVLKNHSSNQAFNSSHMVDNQARRRLSSVLKHNTHEDALLRKTKSMKSRVKFNEHKAMPHMLINDDDFGMGEMSREESVLSISENMVREEYKRFSSQKRDDSIIKKASKKIYKASPSISREQSRIMEEEEGVINNGPKGIESSKEYCNVIDESELIESYEGKTGLKNKKHTQKPKPVAQISATRQMSQNKLKEQSSQLIEQNYLFIKEDIQCIVLNNPNIKNIKLNKGQQVTVSNPYSDDYMEVKLTYQGRDLSVVVPVHALEKKQQKLKIIISSQSSQTLSGEDSKLLRQPSDQCIPTKSIPNFNSFSQSTPQNKNQKSKTHTKPNPYHKFLQPVGHDSSLRTLQEGDDFSSKSLKDNQILDCNQSIPESTFSDASFQNDLEFTLLKPGPGQGSSSFQDQDDMKPSESSQHNSLRQYEFNELQSDYERNVTLNRSETQSRLIKQQMRKALKMASTAGAAGTTNRNERRQTLTYKMSTVQEEQMVSAGATQEKVERDMLIESSKADRQEEQFEVTATFKKQPILKMQERRKSKLVNNK